MRLAAGDALDVDVTADLKDPGSDNRVVLVEFKVGSDLGKLSALVPGVFEALPENKLSGVFKLSGTVRIDGPRTAKAEVTACSYSLASTSL